MGLGGVGIDGTYPEVSKDLMLSKLSVLKDQFAENYNCLLYTSDAADE